LAGMARILQAIIVEGMVRRRIAEPISQDPVAT
jgi:hypothetical protein